MATFSPRILCSHDPSSANLLSTQPTPACASIQQHRPQATRAGKFLTRFSLEISPQS
jgi:hypothetical protein